MSRQKPSHTAGCYFWVPNERWGVWKQLPMVECKAHTLIKGSSSRTRLKQYFTNVNSTDIKKLTYAFPLYEGVSVVGFKCQIGGKVLEGIVKEREEAKQEFNEAVARGESAGLMEQDLFASDVFSTSLGHVPKGSTAIVTIEYIAELKHDLETDALKFEMPTGIAPRYSGPSGMPAHSYSHIYPCAIGNLPEAKGFEWTCDIEMPNAVTKVDSPTHSVSISLGQLSHENDDDPDFKKCSAKMTLQKESGLSKELILTVKSKGIKDPIALWETHPTIANQRALMVTLVPNFALPQIKPEVVFVCDRSGSMRGEPISTLVDALRVMLHSLPANGIKFNICSFGSGCSFLFDKSQSYSKTTLKQAVDHLDTFDADFGGTETKRAIRATIDQRYGDIPLEVILLTDGDIWKQGKLFSYLNEKVEESKQQIRVFPLGIGHGVSTALIEGVARAGNGFASTVMPGERMDQRCVRMLKAALSPHIADYKLEILYGQEEEDDFEIVESVEDFNKLALRTEAAKESLPKKSISLFDVGVDADDVEMADANANMPSLKTPKILQAPYNMPQLYPFSRTTVYLMLGPDTAQRKPKTVLLKGTLDGAELKLEAPIVDIGRSVTLHQLAARRAVQDLEEGRGWPFAARTEDDKTLNEAHPSEFDDLVKREAVKIGTKFQVMNKWCSYVARERTANSRTVERPDDDARSTTVLNDSSAAAAYSDPGDKHVEEEKEESDEDMGFGLFDEGDSLRPPVKSTPTYSPQTSDRAPPPYNARMAAQQMSSVSGNQASYGSSSSLFSGNSSAGLFGGFRTFDSQQQHTSSGLFGGPSTQQSTGGNSFGATATQQSTIGGSFDGLFSASYTIGSARIGTFDTAIPSRPTAGALFGNAVPPPPPMQALNHPGAMSVFDSTSVSSNTAFGNTQSQQQQQQHQRNAARGLFRSASNTAPMSSTSLFGNVPNSSLQPTQSSLQPSQWQAASGGGLFGNTTDRHDRERRIGDGDENAAAIEPQNELRRKQLGGAPEPSPFSLVEDADSSSQRSETLSHGGHMRKGGGGGRSGPRAVPAGPGGGGSSVFARSAEDRGGPMGSFAGRRGRPPTSDCRSQQTSRRAAPASGLMAASAASARAAAAADDESEDQNPSEVNRPQRPLPAFANDAARVRALIDMQEFDGSFETTGENLRQLAHALGLPRDVLLTTDPGVKGASETVWATVLVLAWLEEKMKVESEIWEMSAEKAREWLREREGEGVGLETLMDRAREIVK